MTNFNTFEPAGISTYSLRPAVASKISCSLAKDPSLATDGWISESGANCSELAQPISIMLEINNTVKNFITIPLVLWHNGAAQTAINCSGGLPLMQYRLGPQGAKIIHKASNKLSVTCHGLMMA